MLTTIAIVLIVLWILGLITSYTIGGFIHVLLQQSAAGIGGALGGSDVSSTFHTRRGFERFLFISTFVLAILFVLATLAAIFF
jgi:protein translocase SecG subunit